jgi:hypothetical protein
MRTVGLYAHISGSCYGLAPCLNNFLHHFLAGRQGSTGNHDLGTSVSQTPADCPSDATIPARYQRHSARQAEWLIALYVPEHFVLAGTFTSSH